MKTARILSFLLLLSAVIPLSASSVVIGGLTYNLNTTNNTAGVSGTDASGDVVIPETIESGGVTYTVTSIDGDGFWMSDVTTVVIPNSITSICNYAFQQTTSLKTVTIGNGVKKIPKGAFYNSDIIEIVIPNSVTTVEYQAFYRCDDMTSVVIGSGVTTLADQAFVSCTGIKNITVLADTPPAVSGGTFAYVPVNTAILRVPDGKVADYKATEIWNSFKYIFNVSDILPESISLEPSVEIAQTKKHNISFTIEPGNTSYPKPTWTSSVPSVATVDENGVITAIGIGKTTITATTVNDLNASCQVTVIALKATLNGIEYEVVPGAGPNGEDIVTVKGGDPDARGNLVIPGEVEIDGLKYPVAKIEQSAFAGKTTIKNVVIPGSVNNVGNNAFSGCSGLKEITLEAGDEPIEFGSGVCAQTSLSTLNIDRTTAGTPFAGNTTLSSINIGENKTSVQAGEFSGCTGIVELTIPSTVNEIGKGAFSNCSNLTNVTISNADDPLNCASDAFSGSSVETLVMGRNTEGAPFSNSTTIKNITIGENVTTLSQGEFGNCNSIEEITFEGTTPPNNINGAFSETTSKNATVTVPVEAMDEYRSEMGNDFKNIEPNETLSTTAGGINYEVVFGGGSNGEDIVMVTGGNPTANPLVFPAEIEINGKNYTVTTIANDAFKGNTAISEVIIPGNITSIGDGAFSGCSSLKEVTIANGDSELICGQNIFSGSSVETVNIDRNTEGTPFANMETITTVTIGEHKTTIAEGEFAGTGVTVITIPATVTEIGAGAFKDCASLTEVTVQGSSEASALTIATDAFSGAPVKDVTTDRNTEGTPFANMETITTVTIGEHKTTIAEGEFAGTGVTEITIPATVTEIGGGAFKDCANLSEVTVQGSPEASALTIAADAFSGAPVKEVTTDRDTEGNPFANIETITTVTIGEHKTTIAEGEFAGTGVAEITIPATVTEIGEGAFKDCASLTEVTVQGSPEASALTIAADAFSGAPVKDVTTDRNTEGTPFANMETITSVTIGENKTTIAEGEFAGTSVAEITIPATVTEIGAGAFKDCASLSEVTVQGSPEASALTIAADAFSGAPVKDVSTDRNTEGTPFANMETITSVTIGEHKTTIAEGEFAGTGVTEITIPATVTEIGGGAFKDCENLTGINLAGGENADALNCADDAFNGCPVENLYQNRNTEGTPFAESETLKNVTIGEGVTELSEGEFGNCKDIESITFEGATPPTVPENAFNKTITETVVPKVPDESLEAYENEIGNSFKEIESFDAITATVDGISYKVEKDASGNSVVTVTGSTDQLPAQVVIPEEVTIEGVTYPVTKIDDGAFEGNTQIAGVTIPTSVTEIGEGAFKDCENLKDVVINDGEKPLNCEKDAFSGTGVETVYQGRDTEGNPFAGSENLTEITIGEDVTQITEGEFADCPAITEITLKNPDPEKIDIADNAFDESVYQDATVKVPEGSEEDYKNSGDGSGKFENIEPITEESAYTIRIEPATVNVAEGQSITLTVVFDPEMPDDAILVWSTSDQTIATVNAQGVVTAVKAGKATITATAPNGQKATCEVVVSVLTSIAGPYTDDDLVKVVDGTIIFANGTQGQVFTMSGVVVATSTNGTVANLPRGTYIVKAGGKAFKIIL